MGMVPIETLLGNAHEFRREHGRPLVTLSYAQSLDGSLALRDGHSLTLSGAESLRLTHRLRAAHHAILVGIGTVLADDPQLTVRLVRGEHPQPVVLDSRLRTPLSARLMRHPRSPWIVHCSAPDRAKTKALQDMGARLFSVPQDDHGKISLPHLLDALGAAEVDTLMVEGGAKVIASFLRHHLADRLMLTIAPLYIGGLRVFDPSCTGLLSPDEQEVGISPQFESLSGLHPMISLPRLEESGSTRCGEDLVVWGKLR